MLVYILGAVIVLQLAAFVICMMSKDKRIEVAKEKVRTFSEENTKLKAENEELNERYGVVDESNLKLMADLFGAQELNQKLSESNAQLAAQKEALEAATIELEEMGIRKDELVAATLHDIKNPAAAIQSLVELLESYDMSAHEQQEIMESLVISSASILDMAQGISDTFAKQDFAHKPSMVMGSLKDIIESVTRINDVCATQKGVRLIVRPSSAIPPFEFDPEKIGKAVDNIVSNAIKYSPSGSEVTVRSYYTDTNVTVEVTDKGIGIPKDEVSRIFEKGVKLSPRPTNGESSSGLGMWIVQRIVQEHNGDVLVTSKENRGTTVKLVLPIRQL